MGEKVKMISEIPEYTDSMIAGAAGRHGSLRLDMRVWHRSGRVEYIVMLGGEIRHRSKSLALAAECANELEAGL